MSEWQEIDTAPKDGSDFLGGEFYFDEHGTVLSKEYTVCFRRSDGQLYSQEGSIDPNYWTPLPAPPQY